jgi:[acyl-carrier-protein] S-malonyltransferase
VSPRYAAVFPGQGPLEPAAVAAVADDPLLTLAADLAAVDLPRLLRRGGPALSRTEVLQPLVTAVSLATLARLPRRPALVAGHSLGQVAAWAAAGGISAEDAVRLAHARGLAMAAAARGFPGGLVARDTPEPPSGAVLALQNAPGEWIFAAPAGALPAGRRLDVAGPWHHPAMATAGPALAAAFAALDPKPLDRPWVDDHGRLVTGDPGALLVAQLSRPVDWPAVCRALAAAAVDALVVLAPSRAVAAQTARCLPDARVLRTDPPRALAAATLELR